jgi:hypothetical protein
METTSMVIGGLSGLVLFGLAYAIFGLLKAKTRVSVHDTLIEAVARENATEHEKIHYKMEASDDLLRTEIYSMIQDMHAKLDKTIEVLQNNMNNLDTGQHNRIDQVYRDMDSRLDKMEARLTKKPAREPKSKQKLEQINS